MVVVTVVTRVDLVVVILGIGMDLVMVREFFTKEEEKNINILRGRGVTPLPNVLRKSCFKP